MDVIEEAVTPEIVRVESPELEAVNVKYGETPRFPAPSLDFTR